MAKRKYFIRQYMQQEYLHGGVGCVDAERVLLAKGFQAITFPYHHEFSLKAKISRLLYLVKMIFIIRKGDTMALLFPVYAAMNRILIRLLRLKGVTLFCIIADIDGLRDADDKALANDIRQLQQFRFLVVHNEKMAAWARTLVPHVTCTTIGFFDFLVTLPQRQTTKNAEIVFAANFEKAVFAGKLQLLLEKNADVHFHLYGPGISPGFTEPENVTYHGISKPYELPCRLQGSFGLIWDGDSIETCAGSYGEYLHYNSQHKLSLYIVSALPVIVWEEAATADLVKKYGIGFCIRSLYEIGQKIKDLPDSEYRQMQINMQPLAEKISKGECLGEAIEEMMTLV